MDGIIVEREKLDITTGATVRQYAICTSEPTPQSVAWSLLFEGYLTAWSTERPEVTA